MSSINTNVSAFIANTNLQKSQQSLSTSLERLSTGLRINTGADDPAGLIASQGLQNDIEGITQAISNSTQASNMIATADGALGEVSNLLDSIQSLVVESANTGALSTDQIQANQLQVDSAIASITRISNSTEFGGLKLLDGSLGYVTSGVAVSALHDVNIQNVSFGGNASIPVVVNVVASAQQAQLVLKASSISQSVTLQIAGSVGVQTLSFVSGTKVSAVAFAINRVSDSTGVAASLNSATNLSSGLTFKSTGYGSDQFVSVSALGSSTFATQTKAGVATDRTTGQDAVAIINGAQAKGDGLNLSLNTASLSLSLNLDASFGKGTKTFSITGGGAVFQLGNQVTSNEQINLAINSVSASSLGDYQDGYLSDVMTGGKASLISGNAATASNIVTNAINQVAVIRGQLGAIEANTLQTNINSLQVALENTTSSESSIADTDFAAETSNLSRAQILVQAGVSVLATANSSQQAVLKLLS